MTLHQRIQIQKDDIVSPKLAPGWYVIHFVWSIAEKPTHPLAFKRGDWEAMYPGYKDKTGKYDAFAQGKPFYVSGESDVVKDYKNP